MTTATTTYCGPLALATTANISIADAIAAIGKNAGTSGKDILNTATKIGRELIGLPKTDSTLSNEIAIGNLDTGTYIICLKGEAGNRNHIIAVKNGMLSDTGAWFTTEPKSIRGRASRDSSEIVWVIEVR